MTIVIILSRAINSHQDDDMRLSKEKTAENRARILQAAAKLIRENGILAVGVDAVSEAAGLTHGSVYSQFGSKDQLAAEALSVAFAETGKTAKSQPNLTALVSGYLSKAHKDGPGEGCAIPALGCEVSRGSDAVRGRFTEGVRAMVGRIAELLGPRPARARDDEALTVTSALVGAVMLSRAVDDEELSERILEACKRTLTRLDPSSRTTGSPQKKAS
jgi:TetR/AcrR family transcriptional repressor of nem operon